MEELGEVPFLEEASGAAGIFAWVLRKTGKIHGEMLRDAKADLGQG
jgi:hypothetical protein